VRDVQIEVRLTGASVDESTVRAEQGFYNSITDTLRWGKDTLQTFRELSPGETGIIQFSFQTKNSAAFGIRNPEIILDMTVRGNRENEQNVPEQIESAIIRSIRIMSDMALTPRILHTTGPFSNSGPIPPVVEKETLYTVVWTVTNTANHISGAKVVGTLPSYVRWISNVSPQSEDVRFNPNNNQVTWNIGEVPQGVGTSISPKEVAFQIGLTPSISQLGQIPTLVHNQTIAGFDQFTETQIKLEVRALSTRIQSEPGLPSGHERISAE